MQTNSSNFHWLHCLSNYSRIELHSLHGLRAILILPLYYYLSLNHLGCQHHCPHLIVYHHHHCQFSVVELFDSLKEYLQAAEGLGQSTKEWERPHWQLSSTHVLLDLEDQVAQCQLVSISEFGSLAEDYGI